MLTTSNSWPLNGIKIPLPGRRSPAHKVMSLSSNGLMPPGSHGWDDELEFNTQFSSQWDSLVHVQHQPSGLAYNGIKPTQEGLTSPQTTSENEQPTIDHWHARGGLVGRGVLIDFKAYMESQSKPYHSLDGYRITVEDLEEVARHQGVEFRRGDILIIRTGVTEICKRYLPIGVAESAPREVKFHTRFSSGTRDLCFLKQTEASSLAEAEKTNMRWLRGEPYTRGLCQNAKRDTFGVAWNP